ncbi:MAG: hypothetical protein HYX26_04560 [Acidobacteriales bacterium]|nr:hypothetical protein [Terriglobales bacterium]
MRRRLIALGFLGLLVGLAAVSLAYRQGFFAPAAARMLPDAEGIVYLDLRSIRLASDFSAPAISHEPEYEEFLSATGFQFERDLDELAIAVHAPEPTVDGANVVMQRRYSEIFVGRYDRTRLNHYLHKIAADVERYRDSEILVIPFEGRTVRVSLLNDNMVVASNAGDPGVIRGIMDRQARSVLAWRAPWFLRLHYRDVRFGSPLWAILQLKTPGSVKPALPLPGGLFFSLPQDSVTVASVRYTGKVELRVEAFTNNAQDAERLNSSASSFLQLFHALESSGETRGPDPDVKAFFSSLQVNLDGDRVALTATLTPGFVKKLVSDNAAPTATPPVPTAPETPSKKSKTSK